MVVTVERRKKQSAIHSYGKAIGHTYSVVRHLTLLPYHKLSYVHYSTTIGWIRTTNKRIVNLSYAASFRRGNCFFSRSGPIFGYVRGFEVSQISQTAEISQIWKYQKHPKVCRSFRKLSRIIILQLREKTQIHKPKRRFLIRLELTSPPLRFSRDLRIERNFPFTLWTATEAGTNDKIPHSTL